MGSTQIGRRLSHALFTVIAASFASACGAGDSGTAEKATLQTQTLQSGAVSTPATPVPVPDGYVATPAGYLHSSCIHQIPQGGNIDQSGTVVDANNQVVAKYEACTHPPIRALPSADERPSPKDAGASPPPTINGWVEYLLQYGNAGQPFTSLSSYFTVPDGAYMPASGEVVYYFPGLVDGFGNIIQPVLSYGKAPDYGQPLQWNIASWFVNYDGAGGHSPPIQVNPGDAIYGSMTYVASPTGHWHIVTTDDYSGWSTWLDLNRPNTQTSAMMRAYGAVLEAYNVDSCSAFPSSPQHTWDIFQAPTNWNPSWYWNGVNPQCSYQIQYGGTNGNNWANLYY